MASWRFCELVPNRAYGDVDVDDGFDVVREWVELRTCNRTARYHLASFIEKVLGSEVAQGVVDELVTESQCCCGGIVDCVAELVPQCSVGLYIVF